MAYFSQLPKTTFLNQVITNLTVGVKLSSLISDEVYDFLNYTVEEGEKPEHVAYNYYDDPALVWLIFLSNKILDPYFQWPLDTREFDQWIKKKYGSIAAAQATTIHCEHKTKDITVSADSLVVSNGVSSSDYDAIDAYTYWDKINDNRRQIKLINSSYAPSVIQKFNDLV